MSDTDESYWSEYTGLQHAKHQLLSNYLGGWFPILTSSYGRVIYIDCHAGRGRHTTGHEGSPILALQTLLNHHHKDRILDSTEIQFVFFETDQQNYDYLGEEIAALGEIPRNVQIHSFQSDYEASLRQIVDDLRQRGQHLAPSFVFVDPYGFQLSMELLNSFLQFNGCELLINFMYRYVDMAINNRAQASNMDVLFGGHNWRELSRIENFEDRLRETIAFFSGQLMAKFVTHMNMRGTNKALKYVLLHASNHPKGRNLMKDSMWTVSPDGSFTAYERDNPNQHVLIGPEPDFRLLKNMLWSQFAGKQVHTKQIDDWSLHTSYRERHVRDIVRDYRKRKIVDATGYSGRFGFNKNPLISFPAERPEHS